MTTAEIEVERYGGNPWSFFYEISDVANLGAGEEKGKTWAARADGDVIGMVVVEDFFGTPYAVRVAVVKEWRRGGVATALLERVQEEYDELYCYIDRDNLASMELVAGLGFERGGWAPGVDLYNWSWVGE